MQYLLFGSVRLDSQVESRGPRIRQIRITRFVPRSVACIDELLNRLTAACGSGRALPSGILSQLMTASQPLWRLLVTAADVSPDLWPEVRPLLTRVLSEGAARMRGLVKQMARELVELPYFSSRGQLARDLGFFVSERWVCIRDLLGLKPEQWLRYLISRNGSRNFHS